MKTYNARLIFDSPEDREKVLHTLEAQRFTFNECSKVKLGIKKNSIVDLHEAFYKSFREKNPHITSGVVIRAQQEVLATYRSIKSNKHKLFTAPVKTRLSIRLDHNIYSWKNNILSLSTLGKRVKCKFQTYPKLQSFLDTIPFCDPLLFVRNGEIWIALTFKSPEKIIPQTIPIGIDLGIRYAAVTSEGRFYKDPSFNARKRKLRYLKRCLQSKGSHSARKHLRKLRHKEQRMNRAQAHILANQILRETQGNVLVLEDLSKIKSKKRLGQNLNRISQVPFFLLKTILTYKAPDYGKTVITVSPHYTSQIDHRTDLKDGIRKGMRYTCKDGTVLHADLNAAINIAKRWNDPTMVKTKKSSFGRNKSRNKPSSTPILLEYTKICPITIGQAPVTKPNVCRKISNVDKSNSREI